MAEEIEKIIATINPDRYHAEGSKEKILEFKKVIKEKGFKEALKLAKPQPAEEHKIIYDSATESLEPVYFWILDMMNSLFSGNVEKYVDNFVSTPGSGHFSELMGKATKMQEEAMKVMATVNNVIKAIINIVYDLKNFQIRLAEYNKAKSENPAEREAGNIALKQIWMDNVDIKRGTTSLKGLAGQFEYTMIIDAFMASKSPEDVDKLGLNERVSRILKARIMEFLEWKEKSEKELRQRYELEKTYLKSELASLKLYTRWAKPYLRAAAELEQLAPGRRPELVKAFSTILLELSLLGKSRINVEQEVAAKNLPLKFKRIKFKRNYYSVVVVDFMFRGIPQRVQQGYVYGGRSEVTLRAYALNDDELKMLQEKFDETDVADALKLAEITTGESLGTLQDDIKKFLEETPEKKPEEAKKKSEEVNPFFALLGIGKKKEEKPIEAPKKIEKIEPDNWNEVLIRNLAEARAKEKCFNIFDVYKKAHGMASHPAPEFEAEPRKKTFGEKVIGGF